MKKVYRKESLRELVHLLNRKQLQALKQMDFPFGEQSKMAQLYELVVDEGSTDEADIVHRLYHSTKPTGKHKKHIDAYRHLKASLVDRLLDTLFLTQSNQPSYNDYQKAYYNCWKEWAAVKILVGKNAYTTAIDLTERIFKHAQKYEFTDLCINACELLRFYYATKVGSSSEFERYNRLLKKYNKWYRLESRAEEYYLLLNIHFVNNRSAKKDLADKAAGYFKEIEQDMQNCEAYRLHLYGYLIKLRGLAAEKNYKEYVKTCQEGIDFFKKKETTKNLEVHIPFQIFYHQMLIGYTYLKDREAGEHVAQQALAFFEKGKGYHNWFKHNELHFYLHMHTGNYQAAYDLYRRVTRHSRFKFLEKSTKEIWRIFKAYLHYLILLRKIQQARDDKTFNKVHLGRFLNQTTIYSKDKQGMNISILIIRMLLFVVKQDYDKAADRAEAMRRYLTRHLVQENQEELPKAETYRSYIFIKMLLKIPTTKFSRTAFAEKTQPLLKKLKQLSSEAVGNDYEIEIIPYEQLWELTKESLGRGFE